MTPPAATTPRWRLFVLMALQYFIWGVWLSSLYLRVYRQNPTSAAQYAILYGAFPAAVLIGFFVHAHLADRVFGRERLFAWAHALSGVAIIATAFASGFWLLFVAVALQGLCFAPTLAIANAIVLAHAGEARRDFGVVRAGGTFGWLLALWVGALAAVNWSAPGNDADGFLGAIVRRLGTSRDIEAEHVLAQGKLVLAALGSWILAAFSLTLRRPVGDPTNPPSPGLAWVAVLRTMRQGSLIALWGALLLLALADEVFQGLDLNVLFGDSKSGGLGMSLGASTLVGSIRPVAEIATLLVAGRLLARLGWRAMLLMAVAAHVLRFAGLAFLPASAPALLTLQLLQGVGSALLLTGIALLVDAFFPRDIRASAQSWFFVPALSFAALAGNFARPMISERLGTFSLPEGFHRMSIIALAVTGVAAVGLAIFFHPRKAGDEARGPTGPVTQLGNDFENYPPLFDPVAQLARFLGVVIALELLIGLFVLVRAGGQANGWMAAQLFGPCVLMAGLFLLIRPARVTNVFYLRAFKTDRNTADLRTLLKGALGPDFRLSGIRRPKERPSDFMKGFFSSIVALRYAGSHYMELEARDDWMARLVASYAHARLAFIDLRLLTRHVQREVIFTFSCMGPARSIFLIDNSKDDAAWRAELAAVLQPADAAALQLVNTDRPRAEIAADVRARVAALPHGTAGFSVPAMRFVRDHVSDDMLRAEARRRPGLMIALGAITVGLLGTVLGLAGPNVPVVSLPVALTLLGLFALTWVACLVRTFGTAAAMARWSGRGAAFGGALAGLLVPLLGFTLMIAPSVHAFQQVRVRSQERSIVNSIRQVMFALEMHELENSGGAPPKTPADFRRAVAGSFREFPRDPWGQEIVIESPGRRSGGKYDIYSCGPDRKPGTADDVGNW